MQRTNRIPGGWILMGACLSLSCSGNAQNGVGSPAQYTRERAQMSDAFVNSIGVAMHLNYLDTPYGEYEKIIKPRLLELGIRNVRDGFVEDPKIQDRFLDLAKHGIKSTFIVTNQPKEVVVPNLRRLLPALNAIEGPNETDLPQFGYLYNGQSFPEGTRAYMKDLWTWVKTDPQLKVVPIVGSSMGWGKNAEKLGNVEQWADYGQAHFYTAEADAPGSALDSWHLHYARMTSPTKPIYCTETGYSSAVTGNGISEYAHARYVPRLLLEHWRKGIVKTHLYELIDEWDKPLSELEAHFGLLRFNNTPKPAFHVIKNMITILSDKGKAFSPQTLDFRLEGGNEWTHHFLLQKRDGRFYLVIWNDAKNWDLQEKKNIYTPDQNVTLHLSTHIARVRTFLPMESTSALKSVKNPRQMLLQVPDHPLIVELSRTN